MKDITERSLTRFKATEEHQCFQCREIILKGHYYYRGTVHCCINCYDEAYINANNEIEESINLIADMESASIVDTPEEKELRDKRRLEKMAK